VSQAKDSIRAPGTYYCIQLVEAVVTARQSATARRSRSWNSQELQHDRGFQSCRQGGAIQRGCGRGECPPLCNLLIRCTSRRFGAPYGSRRIHPNSRASSSSPSRILRNTSTQACCLVHTRFMLVSRYYYWFAFPAFVSKPAWEIRDDGWVEAESALGAESVSRHLSMKYRRSFTSSWCPYTRHYKKLHPNYHTSSPARLPTPRPMRLPPSLSTRPSLPM